MDTSKLSNDDLLMGYNQYEKGLMQAQMGDKRRYNTKMDIVYNKSMLSIYENELNKRNMPHNGHFNWK